ncbi:tetratricopeptide repeat protein [Pseudochryseolinea flava]|uniref:SH3b domain-containing protein n=1 Tax=Pseudochryseolinea flava TaxID=2059302 RepID=A0A364Y6R0_9BACT|nr:hypothetical protein [Pseudochryseolinea flava]RAW02620.1 hypothetical protein DQQ10_00470 [Pseudochryseolinea flava]
MQRVILKILYTFFFSAIIFSSALNAQDSSFRLQQADSLFKTKQYTQALDLYKTMFEQNKYTPAMLLKMAYIEEGLAETGQALYHLNLYYNVSHDPSALDKMQELASKYGLQGYDVEQSILLSYFHEYHRYVSLALAALVFLLFAIAVFLKIRKSNPIGPVIAAIIFMIPLALNVNVSEQISTGIITESKTYLMEGPSAGAPVAGIIGGGHRVIIVKQTDVWLQVYLNQKYYYIKQGSILPITI